MATKAVLTVRVELPDYEVSNAIAESEQVLAKVEEHYEGRDPRMAGGNKPRLLGASVGKS